MGNKTPSLVPDDGEPEPISADLVVRAATWCAGPRSGGQVGGKQDRRTLGFAGLGGATLDNEENYLVGFLRGYTMNVYTGPHRVDRPGRPGAAPRPIDQQ